MKYWELEKILQENPTLAAQHDLSVLRGEDWYRLLHSHPQLAEYCDWDKLDGFYWSALLVAHPQLSAKCAWDKLNLKDWCQLLSMRPEFATQWDWSKFLDNDADWKLLELDWRALLKVRPDLSSKRPWDELNLPDVESILAKLQNEYFGIDNEDEILYLYYQLTIHPELENQCNWNRLSGMAWRRLISVQPYFSDRCIWNKLEGMDWRDLLSEVHSLPINAIGTNSMNTNWMIYSKRDRNSVNIIKNIK